MSEGGREEIYRRIDEVKKLVAVVVYKQIGFRGRNRFYEAEDLIQDGVLGVLMNADKFDRERGDFGTFVCLVARRWILSHVIARDCAKRKIQPDMQVSLETPVVTGKKDSLRLADVIPSEVNVECDVVDGEFSEYLQRIISTMPEGWQAVIRLRYWEGLSKTKTGKVLGISDQSVGDKERRFSRRIRRILIDENDELYSDEE